LLFAVKWLGNEGGHPKGGLKRSDLLDGFAILEKVLDEIFIGMDATIREKAKAINKAKGPPKERLNPPRGFRIVRRAKQPRAT
jgi:hypothetical protein